LQKTNSNNRVSVARKEMEMADDVTDQDKAAIVPKVEAACAAAISWVIAAKVRTTIAVSILMAIMFAVVVTGEVAIVTPKPPSSSLQCKVSVIYVGTWDRITFVIATDKNQVVATIPVGVGPVAVAVTPDGTRAYVINDDAVSVSVINTVTNSVLTTFSLVNASLLRAVAISPDGTRVYVAHMQNTALIGVLATITPLVGVLSTIDTVTNQVMFTIPVGNSYDMVVSPDGTRAYLADFYAGLVVVDTVKRLVIDKLSLGPVLAIAITPDGTQVYLTPDSSRNNGTIVVNTATNQVKTFIPIPSNFMDSVAVSPDGKRAYVASYNPKSIVTVIDTATSLVLAHIPIASLPMLFGVAVSVDGTQVYVTDGVQTVVVIDTATNQVMGDPIPVGSGPIAMATAWIPC
jgi:YVTN family beta-propeller protein